MKYAFFLSLTALFLVAGCQFASEDKKTATDDMKKTEAVWRYAFGRGITAKEPYAFEHKALMPEKLARDHILSWSRPGDLVLDPFSGAGTTAKMALLLGRKYLGFEINREFHELAMRRVRDATLGLLAA